MLLAVHALSLAALAPPPQRVSSGLDRRALLGAALAAAVLPPAPSFADEVEMSEITSRNIDCPKKFFLPAKGSWQCIEVTAKANNIGKKDLGAAGVYGRVRDADGYPCLAVSLDDKSARDPRPPPPLPRLTRATPWQCARRSRPFMTSHVASPRSLSSSPPIRQARANSGVEMGDTLRRPAVPAMRRAR